MPQGEPTSRPLFLLRIAAWLVTLALATLAALRIVAHDAPYPLTWFNAFTLYLYLPAYAILILASLRRWVWLAGVSLLVVICHLVWVAPDLTPATPLTSSPGDTRTTLRIFYVNGYSWNTERDALIAEALASQPDLILIAEFNEHWQQSLRATPAIADYAYGTDLAAPVNADVAILSRLPIDRPQPAWATSRAYLAVDVPLDGKSLRLITFHGPRPMHWTTHDYAGFWKIMIPTLLRQPRPLAVIADFNATQHSRVIAELTAGGLRSAHVDRGRGYATTWPKWHLPVPPVRVDQALLSPDIECLRCDEGIGPGTDHRPLILELRLRDQS